MKALTIGIAAVIATYAAALYATHRWLNNQAEDNR